MKHGHDNIFTKTGKKYGQYQWAEQTISEWVVEDRVLPLGDGGKGGGGHWETMERGQQLDICGERTSTEHLRKEY